MTTLGSPGRGLASWLPSPSAPGHFDVLDGLRGLAILLVVFCHAAYSNPQAGPLKRVLQETMQAGYLGVPLFFVLSGCVISYPFWKQREAGGKTARLSPTYARRRFWKIVPPYWLSIAVFLAFYLWVVPDVPRLWPQRGEILRQAFSWAVGLPELAGGPVYFNLVYWSLAVEVGFYLLFPLLVWAVRPFSSATAAGMLFLVLVLLSVAARHLGWLDPVFWPDVPMEAFSPGLRPPVVFPLWTHPFLRFARFADCFAWGILFSFFLARHQRQKEDAKVGNWGGLGAMLLAGSLIGVGMWRAHADPGRLPSHLAVELQALVPNLAAFLLLFYAYRMEGLDRAILTSPLIRWMGIVSYEWYLFHLPFLALARYYAGPADGSIARYLLHIVPPIVGTLLLAALVYRCYSLPLLRRMRT